MKAKERIVAAVDGSPSGWDALTWAAYEAAAMKAQLHVVHCGRSVSPATSYGPLVPIMVYGDRDEDPLLVLDLARSRLMRTHPMLSIRADIVSEPPPQGILTAARGAYSVVVGSRGHSGLGALVLGSTALRVVSSAPCPAVVVRRPRNRGKAALPDHIVVGVDGSEGSQLALRFAFEEASARGLPVAAAHVSVPSPFEPDVEFLLTAELEPWMSKYPDVPVTERYLSGRPARELRRISAGAAMVVVGSRGHGELAGLLLGSVGLALVQRADCPVVVAHGDTP